MTVLLLPGLCICSVHLPFWRAVRLSRGGREESVWPGAGRQHGQRAQGPPDQEQGHQARQGEGGGRGGPGVGAGRAAAGLLHVRDDRADQHQPSHSQAGKGRGGGEHWLGDVSSRVSGGK